LRQRGLTDAQLLRGASKASGTHNGVKIAKLMKVHGL